MTNQEAAMPHLPDVCVRCATCMAACPVARVTPRFPGPKQAGPGAQRFRSSSEASVDDWIDLCTSCRLCDIVCPAGVPITELNLRAKAKYFAEQGRSLRDWLLVRSDVFGELAARYSRRVNPLLRNRLFRWFLDKFLGIDRRRELPPYEYPTFRRWFESRQVTPASEKAPAVAYFHGCFTNTNEVRVGKAATALLEAYGFAVQVPPQRCCGLPRLGVGDLRGAAEMGRRNIALLAGTVQKGIDIVFTSTSCGLMLRHEYGPLLRLAGAEGLAERLFSLEEYLLNLHREGKAAVEYGPLRRRVAYFAPCHLKALNTGLPALELMRLVPGLEVLRLTAECCGLAGLYGFRKEKFAIAEQIGRELAAEVERLAPEMIVSECEGCRMQLRRLTGRPVLHSAELLVQALPSRGR